MPEGARAIIARTDTQTIVNRTRAPDIQQLISLTDADDEAPLYTGEIGTVELPRLLYRYAVSRVSGRLHLQQRSTRCTIEWRDGRIVRVSSAAPHDLLGFLDTRGLLPSEEAKKLNLPSNPSEAKLVRIIVDSGRAGHGEVLAALETYARTSILALFKVREFNYAFSGSRPQPVFPFGPAELYMLLNEGVSAHAGAVQIEAFISAHHRHTVQRRSHEHIDVAALHLTTKQLRLWNATRTGLTVAAQMTRWIAIPGINHDTASRLLVLLERVDLISLEASDRSG